MGEKQIIISVSREFGSGGHEIARRIAEYMQLEFLDRNMIEMIAKEKLVDANNLHPYDEAPRFVPRRTVKDTVVRRRRPLHRCNLNSSGKRQKTVILS